MLKYIASRGLQIIVTLLVFQTLLFLILDARPGDITTQYMLNPDFTEEQREALRVRLGLDKPPLQRYLQWLANFATGNLGISSAHYPRTVVDVLLERAPRTVFLFLTSTLVQFLVGFSLGRILAWQRGGVIEYGTTFVGVVLYTVFTPWFGLMMIVIFGSVLDIFPLGKFLDPVLWRHASVSANAIFYSLLLTATVYAALMVVVLIVTRKMSSKQRTLVRLVGWLALTGAIVGAWALFGQTPDPEAPSFGRLAVDMVWHLILPVINITLVGFGGTMLMTRSTMLETLREDYILTARAKGLSEKVVRDRHAARNALLPVFTSLIISLPFVLSGGIITESVFSWPGMGLTLLQASQGEDIPLAMGALSFIGIVALVSHFLADIMYALLDPRVRHA